MRPLSAQSAMPQPQQVRLPSDTLDRRGRNGPRVEAVVVTHNGSSCVRECLQSLYDSDYPTTVTVIDNASSDGTQEVVQSFATDVRLLRLDRNVGFGRANNVGINTAMADDADYVLLVNQDAFLEPSAVGQLVQAAEANPEYGILSPLHLSGDGHDIDRNFVWYISDGAPQYYSDLVAGRSRRVYPVGFLNAAAWLVRRRCLEQCGGFDPLFFMYCEDNDLCARIALRGYRVGLVPGVTARHARTNAAHRPATRWARVRRRSDRLLSTMLLTCKTYHRPFAVNVLLWGLDLCRDAVVMLCGRDRQGVAALVLAGLQLLTLLPRVWWHRRASLRGGRLWLDPDSAAPVARRK